MEIKLNKISGPFSLEHTLDCGQLFRWKKLEDWWYGVVSNKVIKIKQNKDRLIFQIFPETENIKFVEHYLRLDDNLQSILFEINKDEHMKKATKQFSGLRLCRQEPWECLISYICATYKNIPAIKKMVASIARQFGEKITVDGYTFNTFPKPSTLAQASLKELRQCSLGFRTTRILETAKIVASKKLFLESLKNIDYSQAKKILLNLPGVGQKVADCVLLFSLEKLNAFPIDVWIKRAVTTIYSSHFDSSFIKQILVKGSLTSKEYKIISYFGREYFGRYAGYAQEYLFHLLRTQQQN
jgi:N-glycosylase/DNA lyase